ncbi:MAG TPA: carboxypeptidase M32 [Firmicutes bacterium]|nr:carboxypeptidase M32 [Bacillota bacterium]
MGDRQQLATAVEEFKELMKRIRQYEEAAGILAWDLRTGAPRKGVAQRSEVVGMLSGQAFALSVSDQMGRLLETLSAPEAEPQLDGLTQAALRECRKQYERSRKIPPARYQEFVTLCAYAENLWPEAKARNDFAGFRPHLERIVATLIDFAELWGYTGHRYDALLDLYEPGLTVEKLDAIFSPLREGTVRLLQAIAGRPAPRRDFLRGSFAEAAQRRFSEFILGQMGYDFEAGRLDTTAHPFTLGLSPGDVRVTTRFDPAEVAVGLFGTIHEGGHALYEQNLSPELVNTPLCTAASMGLHESQSRFWENIIGRSREFWARYFGDLAREFPGQFSGVTPEEFYRAVNLVEPSLIRTEADELTYNLHIIVRYEIEKDLIGGDITVKDLPEVWEAKMVEYLGIKPTSQADGVLQDIHWASGMFGYFPSYALGNVYAAQLAQAMRKQLPDYPDQVRRGNFTAIRAWLQENVWRHGKLLSPSELLRRATGKEADVSHLVAYLEGKLADVYGLSV